MKQMRGGPSNSENPTSRRFKGKLESGEHIYSQETYGVPRQRIWLLKSKDMSSFCVLVVCFGLVASVTCQNNPPVPSRERWFGGSDWPFEKPKVVEDDVVDPATVDVDFRIGQVRGSHQKVSVSQVSHRVSILDFIIRVHVLQAIVKKARWTTSIFAIVIDMSALQSFRFWLVGMTSQRLNWKVHQSWPNFGISFVAVNDKGEIKYWSLLWRHQRANIMSKIQAEKGKVKCCDPMASWKGYKCVIKSRLQMKILPILTKLCNIICGREWHRKVTFWVPMMSSKG